MFKTPEDTRAYVDAFRIMAAELVAQADIALAAPFVDLDALRVALEGSTIGIGAQDCFWEAEGAFTGEVSAPMLSALGVQYCIVGHSERREFFGETDETVSLKISALLGGNITPIVCVGETHAEHHAGTSFARVEQQLHGALGSLSDAERAAVVVAYEPVWAIGTGLACDAESADTIMNFIRRSAGGLDEARIIYGGSMKPANATALCAQPNIDGGLVGSASLDPAEFLSLISCGLQVLDAR
ncbi:MAG: triose-phosphate isomerase [Candidatus Eremiobacteraeota bacterium]|nr:triose-phosphate isomerase [Candidatus Eremiobacteraeota bacterium]MBC5826388.1 triose-phosphate isomerase [Candidatus Eremiobacteraeota bacterium]